MTKDKVKEIIEDIFEGEWKDNNLIVTSKKKCITTTDMMTTINLLIEQKYINITNPKSYVLENGDVVHDYNIILN